MKTKILDMFEYVLDDVFVAIYIAFTFSIRTIKVLVFDKEIKKGKINEN